MSSSIVSRFTLICCVLCISGPVFGAENAADSNRSVTESAHEKRRLLAQDFVARLKSKMAASKLATSSILPGESLAVSGDTQQATFSQIAVGSEMQFRPRVEDITLDYDIYAIKEEGDFYLSLSDVIATLNFPITLNEDEQTAKGWFLREDWLFNLDVKAGQAASRGQSYVLTADDIHIVDNEIFIAGRVIGAWLGMEFSYDVSQQYINIVSEYPLPIVAQIKRRERGGNSGYRPLTASLPRKEYERKMLNIDTVDLSERTNYARSGDGNHTETRYRGDAFIAGEALKHDAFLILGADDLDGLTSVTTRLSRTSEDPDLLGFMKARTYMMGDIDTVNVPLLGDSPQELGFRASNNPLSGISYQNTQITGYALPGWDVELYRGTSLLDTLSVDASGRYQFNDVQLFAGDNDFDVFFYGSQGEIRRETLSIPLNANTLSTQANTYDFSVSLLDSQTYRKLDDDDQDENTLHAAGQYNYYLGNALAYTGFRMWDEEGEQKVYLGSGLTAIWAGAVIDANFGLEDNGEVAGRIGLRRTIADWRTAFAAQVQSDGFAPGDDDVATTLQLTASTQRNFQPIIGTSASVSFDAEHREYSNGADGQTLAFGLSQGFTRVSFSNSLRYDQSTSGIGESTERVFNELSSRMRWSSQVTTRSGVSYMIRPDTRLDRYFANLNYRPGNNLNFDLEFEHQPETDHSEVEIKANYTHQRFRFSPFLRLDNDRDLAAGFNISTSLIDSQPGAFPLITSDRLSSQGMVSAFVYLDANGNMVFDERDEALPGVVVESINSYRRQQTNEAGYALLSRLSTTMATDIHVDSASLPDPFMIPVNAGSSILPRPSIVYKMEFPIQFASEIDGTVAMKDGADQKVAKFVGVVLLPLAPGHRPLIARAAQDGFYVVSAIPPGQYYVTLNGDDVSALKAARPKPQLMNFSHKGDSIYAHDMVLTKGRQDIHFVVLDPVTLTDWTGPATFLRVPQEEKGGLLNLVYRLRMREVIGQVTAGLSRYESLDRQGNVIMRYVVPGGLEEAWARCELMSHDKLPCTVEVVPDVAAPVVPPVIEEKVGRVEAGIETGSAAAIAQH